MINRFILKLAGKDEFQLDDRISIDYIIRQCWKYGLMLLKGRIFSLGWHNISNDIFVGFGVRIIKKGQLKTGRKCKLHNRVYIDALSEKGVILGNNVVIGRESRIECTGSMNCIGKGIQIGDRSTFGNNCFFGAAGGIEIGEDVMAGQFIRFHSENHNFDDLSLLIREQGVSHKGIKVGNNCWIGSGVVFLDGAELGNGCVVAANAVVTKHFGDNCVIGGIPAKVIRYRGLTRDE